MWYSASAASGSILGTTNLSSGDWIGVCGWEHVTGALADHLTHLGNMLETSDEGHRFELSRQRTVVEGADKADENQFTSGQFHLPYTCLIDPFYARAWLSPPSLRQVGM